ncbi:MAG: hypothetical protein V7641_58 [Blastocatellia bacterium]
MTMPSPQIYEFGRFRLDAAERTLRRAGEAVPLTPKVFGILLALVEHSPRIVEKDELMRQVWPDSFVEEGNLTQNISLLRKALGETSDGKPYIETVARRGYRFVADVTKSGNGEATGTPAVLRLAAGEMAEEPTTDEMAARDAFAPEPFAAQGSLIEVAAPAAGDNTAAATARRAAPSALLASSATGVAGPIALPVATRIEQATATRASLWSRMGGRRVALVAAISFIVIASAVIYFSSTGKAVSGGNIDSIAVLSFAADAGDAETEFLNDRLAENLINNLAQLPKLRVVPRGLTFNYKGNTADLQKIGRELGVRALLTGHIHRQGDTLSVQVDLIDVANVSQIWGRRYDRKMADLLLVPEDISKDIFENLRL